MELEPELEYESVFISFQLSARGNKLITESATRSGRTKKKEALLRLEDHLRRYRSISEISKAIEI